MGVGIDVRGGGVWVCLCGCGYRCVWGWGVGIDVRGGGVWVCLCGCW